MLQQLISWIDRQKISIAEWLTAYTGVVFVRFLLEAFSNPPLSGIVASDGSTLVHYWVFFLTAILGIACILQAFTKKPAQAAKLALFGSTLLWLAPIIDIMLTQGNGISMGYFFGGAGRLLYVLYAFFLPVPLTGLTPGMRIEILIILALAGIYVWHATRKNLIVSAGAVICIYIFIFIIGVLPDFFYVFSHMGSEYFAATGKDVVTFIDTTLTHSTITDNTLHGTLRFGIPGRNFDYRFNAFMSQVLFLIASLLGGFLLSRVSPEKFNLIIKNSRWERVALYLSLLGLGMLLAHGRGLMTEAFSWVDALGVITLAMSLYYGGMFAIHTNDIADARIDQISNPGRPLIKGRVSVEDMRQAGFLWLASSLVGAYACGYYPFYMIAVFTGCYYVYSAPPLRLKRIPMLSSLLISIAILTTVLSGFFLLSGDKKLSAFPLRLALSVVVLFTLAVNMRDIKDIAGDRADKIGTLPVLFKKQGIKIVGILFALSFALAPLLLQTPVFYYVTLPAAGLAYWIATREPYEEKWVFVLYFCVIGACVAITTVSSLEFPGLLH